MEIKYQLDATGVFIADLIACSTCFGHHRAHHQELKSIIQWFSSCWSGVHPPSYPVGTRNSFLKGKEDHTQGHTQGCSLTSTFCRGYECLHTMIGYYYLQMSWGLCVRFAGCCSILQTGHITLSSTPDQQTWKTTARNTTGSNHCIILLSSWWWA